MRGKVVLSVGGVVVVETATSFSVRIRTGQDNYRVLCSKAHSARPEDPPELLARKKGRALADAVVIAQAVEAWGSRFCPRCEPCVCNKAESGVDLRGP